ncbi:CD63 antigen-like [Battus philenor]|uniref:CD63 antigen-like n=1 Tax=Battus philenor TaxID=42288 RepID=UPI0035D07BEA
MRSSGLVLFACAGLLLSGGAILGGSTAFTLLRLSYYFWTTDLGAELGASILFIAGAFLCLPACWLATLVPYRTKSVSILATLMLLVTTSIMLLSTGMSAITGLSKAIRDPAALNASMLRAMSHDAFDPAVRTAFSAMQIELKCCGVHSYTDWYQYRGVLPPSCCGRLLNGKNGEQCISPLHSVGCLRPALTELRLYINSVCLLASAIIVVMTSTLFTAAYTLVSGAMERKDSRALKIAQPLRIACLHPTLPPLSNQQPINNITPQI